MSDSTQTTIPDPPWMVPERSQKSAKASLISKAKMGPGPMLRSMLLIAALTVIVVSGCLVAWVVYSMRQTVMDEALPTQTRIVEQMARSLAFRVEQQQKPLLALAAVVAEHMNEPRDLAETLLAPQASMARLFDDVQVADSRGQLLLNLQAGQSKPSNTLPESAREALRRGLVEGKPLVRAVIRAGESGSVLELQHVVPMRNAQGKLMGVLGASARVSAQNFLPLEAEQLNKSSRLFLYGKDGKLLAQSSNTNWQLGGADDASWVVSDVDLEWLASAQSATVSERKGAELWSAVPLPWTQWILVKVSNVQDWAPSLSKTFYWTIAGAVLLIAAALAIVLALIAYPITAMFRRAERAIENNVVDEVEASVRGANWWQRLSEHDWGEAQTLRAVLQTLGRSREAHNERELQLQLQLQTLMDYAPVGLVVTDASSIQRVGMQAARILGYTPRELQGMPIYRLCATPQSHQQLMDRISRDLDIYGQFDSETCMIRKDGSSVWVRIHGQSMQRLRRSWEVAKREVKDDFFVWEVEDVTTQRQVREKSSWKAMHDPLTHLPNRAAFAVRLKDWLQECVEASRMATSEFSETGAEPIDADKVHGIVLYLDLDHFSQVNHQGGRQVGDEVLGHIARLVEASVRPHGWVARVGGDEFAVLMPGATQEQGMRIAQLLCIAVQDWEGSYEGLRYLMGVSIGLLVLDAERHTVASALKAADMACYAAKRKGRNRVEVMTDAA